MLKQKRLALLLGVAVVISVFISACGGGGTTGSSTPGATNCPAVSGLTGAGATFDNPLVSKMFAPDNYPKTKCGVNVDYQSVGSGDGINQLHAHPVDFGPTDTPLTAAQQGTSTGGPIIHIPV